MSNDNKTLADAQPGGRVRLGDQAERARFEQYRGGDFERDAHGYYTNPRTAQDWAMWQAALSAQPSPGGQRDDSPMAKMAAALRGKAEAERAAFDQRVQSGEWGPMPDNPDVLELPPLPEEVDSVRCMIRGEKGFAEPCDYYFNSKQIRDYARTALAASQPVSETDAYQQGFRDGQDRTCTVVARQPVGWQPMESAPKDGTVVLGLLEGSDIPQSIRFRDGWEIAWDGYRIPAHDGPLRWAPLYAATPAQQPAQVYLDGLDRALGEAIDQRDRYHEMADDLAGHIAAITGVDIGEHSSANCPWQNAIEAAEEYKPAQAVDLGQFREVVSAANARLQSVIGDNMMPWSEREKASKEQAALYPLLALAASQPVGATGKNSLTVGGGQEPVAYLDLGEGGYMDVGTDLSDEELAALPKGRHMLGIIGTYGVDGYKPAQAVDLGALERVRNTLHEMSKHVPEDWCDPVIELQREVQALIDGKVVCNG
ncbi:hypothetical protein [Stenotrophomonas maltophilia]|uniref:Uncharacterized protein n=1 Tax=Stenotrophomonas maltophilia TaxID=40324 RepID=A0AB34TDQ6_STEMA|nr:hypothetical protein [Stenotrophomonas maltophilia]KOO75326.1 hypothetical protein VL23_17430 [Stenotrophomonas maltophilia]